MRRSGILCLLLVVVPAYCSIICQIVCPQYQQPPCGRPYTCGGCCNFYQPPRPYPIIYPPPNGQLYPLPFPNYPIYPPITRPTIIWKPTPKPQGPVTVVVNTSNTIKEWHCPADLDKEEDYKLGGELPLECESDADCSTFSVRHKCCYHYGLDTHICKPAVTV
ncbi:hypothetical protein RI129_010228 [Pyrocoelia pectoralis]|uniref:Uncharacterized protein n=1 Tax=Pyrocoelia pectoralis TaxID=417401 RepID=A0AAN7VA30_9COLE